MTILAVAVGGLLGFALGYRADTSVYRKLPPSRQWAATVTALLRSFAFGIPTGAALAGVPHDSPFVAVGLGLLSFTLAYCVSGPLTHTTDWLRRPGGRGIGLALLQVVLGSGAAALGAVLGGALVL